MQGGKVFDEDNYGGSAYADLLAKHRPISPPNQPFQYVCYLDNLVHTVSRQVTGETRVNLFNENTLISSQVKSELGKHYSQCHVRLLNVGQSDSIQ